MASDIVWQPSAERIASANISHFARCYGFDGQSYEVLHGWSISQPGAFWSAVWDFCGVIGNKGDVAFVPPPEGEMLGGQWFPEAKLNFAENLLAGPDGVAVIEADESGIVRRLTRGELRREVERVASGLRAAGVRVGDRVAGILPNRHEGLVALLATAAIGAIWSSCSPDFGTTAILDRLGQIGPKVLFAASTYSYAGKQHHIADRLREIIAGMPTLALVVLTGPSHAVAGLSAASCPWNEFGDAGAIDPGFVRLPFAQPLYVLYTSGTTGKPKAIVHCAGGVLLQHLKEHRLHSDLRPGDVLSWYSNVAWMMYHWSISALASGAAVVLTDGAAIPKVGDGLDIGHLWRVAAAAEVTHFGTSPKFLQTVADAGYRPGDSNDLSALQALLSAGAPVAPQQFDWLYEAVKQDMMVASISGGTEIIGCFMLDNPALPVRCGHLTAKRFVADGSPDARRQIRGNGDARCGRDAEQDFLVVIVRHAEYHAVFDFGETIEHRIDFRGAYSHAAWFERGIGAAVDDARTENGHLGQIAMRPDAGSLRKVGIAKALVAALAPKGQRDQTSPSR